MRRARGFTLIELLVALAIMALMAVLSWRGLDAMTRVQERMQQRDAEVQAVQAGLAQWGADLDATMALGPVPEVDWDGVVLRMTRRSTVDAAGVLVVAWTRRAGVGQDSGLWQRWQSPPVRTRGDLDTAWQQAQNWARNAGTADAARSVSITPLAQWQIYYFRNDAWTNPLSSGGGQPEATLNNSPAPDGVRLVLTLPPGGAVAGSITRDWARPTLGGGKS